MGYAHHELLCINNIPLQQKDIYTSKKDVLPGYKGNTTKVWLPIFHPVHRTGKIVSDLESHRKRLLVIPPHPPPCIFLHG